MLNKSKPGGLFRKDRAMSMGIPEEYDDNVEYHRTHQELLPNEEKENLDCVGALQKPTPSIRSVLVEVGNTKNIAEVLKQVDLTTKSKNSVSWSDVVRMNV